MVGLSLMNDSRHIVARRPANCSSGMLDGVSNGARLGASKEGVSNGDRTRNPRSHSPVLLRRVIAEGARTSDGPNGCREWTGRRDGDGYARYGADAVRVHRVVLGLKLGRDIGRDEVVRHSCDNPPCINPDHLKLGTQFANVADREARGRTARGGRMPWAKLAANDVLQIVELGQHGMISPTDLAANFGVSRATVNDILAGRRWNSVTGYPRARKPIPYAQRGENRRSP